MKCNYCGSEWNSNFSASMSITTCPLCGKKLFSEEEKLNTVEAVLVEIQRLYGVNVLANEKKLAAFFSDLAPQLSKQRRMLNYFIECGGPTKLFSASRCSDYEQLRCIEQIVKEMNEEMYIEEAAARNICNSFLLAISGNRLKDDFATDPSENDNASSNKKTTTQNSSESIITAEKQYQKGETYYNGTDTIKKDYYKAFAWYKKAALLDHPMAQCQVGLMYSKGQGVDKDEREAFEWFKKAADDRKNCPRGKFYVGRCFHFGIGVFVDYAQAVKWYTMAAEQGDAYAQVNLGFCYENGNGVEINLETAVYWYMQSAKQGDSFAQCKLGLLYLFGKGVFNNSNMAFSLFKQSADQGNPRGMLELGRCYLIGLGTEKDTGKAFKLIEQAMKHQNKEELR